MLAAYEISQADVGTCPSCHRSFQTFKPDALNHWWVVQGEFCYVANIPSDSCHQASFFHDASKDASLEVAKASSKATVLELMQIDREVSSKRFKYLWAVFNSSWEYGNQDEVERSGSNIKQFTKPLASISRNSVQSAPAQTFSRTQDPKWQDKRTSAMVIGRHRHGPPSWYCCECHQGPFSSTFTPACVNCGHAYCEACTLEWQ